MPENFRDPQKRPKTEEFASFLEDIAAEIEHRVDDALSPPAPEISPESAEDDRVVREWPEVFDRMIEELR